MLTNDQAIPVNELVDRLAPVNVTQKPEEKTLEWGPGDINLASPEIGYISDVKAIEFMSADDLNVWAKDNPIAVIVYLRPIGDRLFALYGKVEDDTTREEKRAASIYANEKLEEFRKKRAEMKAADEAVAAAKDKEDIELRQVGRHCAEVHHTVVHFMRGKTKNQRKTLADRLIVWAKERESNDKVLKEFKDVLAKYVKEGLE